MEERTKTILRGALITIVALTIMLIIPAFVGFVFNHYLTGTSNLIKESIVDCWYAGFGVSGAILKWAFEGWETHDCSQYGLIILFAVILVCTLVKFFPPRRKD